MTCNHVHEKNSIFVAVVQRAFTGLFRGCEAGVTPRQGHPTRAVPIDNIAGETRLVVNMAREHSSTAAKGHERTTPNEYKNVHRYRHTPLLIHFHASRPARLRRTPSHTLGDSRYSLGGWHRRPRRNCLFGKYNETGGGGGGGDDRSPD